MDRFIVARNILEKWLLEVTPPLKGSRFPGLKALKTRVIPSLLALLFFLFPATVNAAYDDASIKAAFIYRLLYFIEPPVAQTPGAITLCVLGDNPFVSVKAELEARRFENKPLIVEKKNVVKRYLAAMYFI